MPEATDKIHKVLKENKSKWLSIEGVAAVGIGSTGSGGAGIIVSVKELKPKILSEIPSTIEDVPVEIREVGEIKAL